MYLRYAVSDPEYKLEFNVLSDLRKSIISILLQEIPLYVEYFNSIPNSTGKKKLALVLSAANHHICLNILLMNIDKIKLDIQLFTTVEKAAEWLGLVDDVKEIKDTLSIIKKSEMAVWK